jgi:hypothetical protein
MNKLKKIALENSVGLENSEFEIAIDNESPVDSDGWALIAPFGEHPKTRIVTKEDGTLAIENFIQVVDGPAVDAILQGQNKLLPRLKRALVGIPVYKLHPDLKEHAPTTVNTGNESKETMGVIDKFRKSDRGLEAHFTLTQAGAEAVTNDGYKYPSIFWWCTPTGQRNGSILMRPNAFISAGLTPTPNIKGVESLANSLSGGACATPAKNKTQNTMKEIFIGWLAAQGVSLANDAGDQSVLAEVNKIMASRSKEAADLRAENTTLTGQKTALENSKAELTTQLTKAQTDLATANTALANSKTSFDAERKAHAEEIADSVIFQGRRPVADRDAIITALCNSTDFAADVKKLKAEAVKYKVGQGLVSMANSKSTAAGEDPRATVSRLVDERMKSHGDTNPSKYGENYNAVLRENPTLADALKARPATPAV